MTQGTENYMNDGFIAPILGMNEGVNPLRLNKDEQYRLGLNVSCRGGLLHTRPKFIDTNAVIPDGTFQGAYLFSMNSGDRIVVVVDGIIFTIYVNVTGIDPYTVVLHGDTVSTTVSQVYFTQADQYLVIQDGINDAVIIYEKVDDFETYTGRRDVTASVTSDETITSILDEEGEETGLGPKPTNWERGGRIPKGTVVRYAHGRIFLVPVVVPDTAIDGRRFFIAGDIILPDETTNVLWFTSEEYLAEGGAITPPFESGFIGAMGILRSDASGTGYGSLIVFGRYGVSAYAVQAARATWKDIDFSAVLFFGSGTQSQRSIVNVNNDLFYRSDDGIRSIGNTVNSNSTTLTNKPISNEVSKLLANDVGESLPFVSCISVDNRVFCTSQPVTVNGERCFKGLISYDLATFYSITQKLPPIYDGIWTGLNFTQILFARGTDKNKTLFAFHKEDDGGNKLFYLAKDGAEYEDNDSSHPLTRVYTTPLFVETSHIMKQLKGVDLWLNDIQGEVSIKIYYRYYGYKLWNEFNDIVVNADMAETNAQPQSRARLRFMLDNINTSNPLNNMLTIAGHMFEFCIEWQGHCELTRFNAFCIPVDRANQYTFTCNDEDGVALTPGTGGEEIDDFTYEIGV